MLVLFFLVSFAASWTVWTLASAMPSGAAAPVYLLGTFVPGLTALVLTRWREGRDAMQKLLGSAFKADVSARWYVFAIGFMPAIKLVVAVVHRLVTGTWPQFGQEPLYLIAGAIIISTLVQAGEEIGWRGFALPRLTRRVGLAPASIILGMIWASWHLPFFFMRASDTYGQSFLLYFMQVTAVSVTIAWLYWRTGGSLLLVMILHAAINNTKDIVPSAVPGATDVLSGSASLVGWLTVALLWIAASYLLGRMSTVRTLDS